MTSERIPRPWEVRHVRLDRIAEIPPGYLGSAGCIGRLTEIDIAAIKAILVEITR